jgi:hypothetical protein
MKVKKPFGKPRRRGVYNNKMEFRETSGNVDWTEVTPVTDISNDNGVLANALLASLRRLCQTEFVMLPGTSNRRTGQSYSNSPHPHLLWSLPSILSSGY